MELDDICDSDPDYEPDMIPCPECDGTGNSWDGLCECRECSGDGWIDN